MSYSYTGGMPTAQRERRRLIVLTLLGLVLVAIVVGVMLLLGGRDDQTTTGAATGDGCPAPPAGITVDVYNATDRIGLAGQAAGALQAREFAVGETGNAPTGTRIDGPGEIRYGSEGHAGAEVLSHHLPGSVLVEEPRAGTRVDLVLGTGFEALSAPTGAESCTAGD